MGAQIGTMGVDGYLDAPATAQAMGVDLQLDSYGSLLTWGPVQASPMGVSEFVWPYPTEADRYMQKVYDPVPAAWVHWETVGFADVSGVQYPYGQAQYAGVSGYRVVSIFHTRNTV